MKKTVLGIPAESRFKGCTQYSYVGSESFFRKCITSRHILSSLLKYIVRILLLTASLAAERVNSDRYPCPYIEQLNIYRTFLY